MRALWSGSLSFGLVNIPVNLYSATSDRGLRFKLLRKKDLCPISYARVCRSDGREVPYEDIVRGYEYERGEFVVVAPEDFERANARKTKTVDVVSFADEDEIDTKFVDKPYYLEPDKKAENAYVLLREALRKSKRVGIAKFVIREREHLGMIKVEGNAIMLVQLRFADEVKPASSLEIPGKQKVADKEMSLATLLIDQLTKPFDPKDYHDTYTEELQRVIDAKAKGKKPTKKGQAPVATAVPDLMDVLRKSLQQEQKQKGKKKERAKV